MAALTRAAAVARSPLIDWGLAERPCPGGSESGDRHVIQPFASGVLLAVVDGLGHGEPAAAVARLAATILTEHAGEPVGELVERCHAALAQTRGVVLSLASIDARDLGVTWIGVGNVEAVLVRGHGHGQAGSGGAGESPQLDERARDSLPRERKKPPAEHLLLRPGVVGQKLPSLQAVRLAAEPGDTLVLATDGIRSDFPPTVTPARSPRELADAILAQHGRDTDDALVLVARLQGAAG
jgi:serine/threonine protein phosphatase PrpC